MFLYHHPLRRFSFRMGVKRHYSDTRTEMKWELSNVTNGDVGAGVVQYMRGEIVDTGLQYLDSSVTVWTVSVQGVTVMELLLVKSHSLELVI